MSENTKEQGQKGWVITSKHQMNNMLMERTVVPNSSILEILKVTQLTEAEQEDVMIKLVERRFDWLELEPERQIDLLKVALTEESVVTYLKADGIIRSDCNMVQVGIDEEGSVVVEAYYVSLNRETRRSLNKAMSKEEKERAEKALNIFSAMDGNLIDLAEQKLKKIQEEKKKVVSVDFKKRK